VARVARRSVVPGESPITRGITWLCPPGTPAPSSLSVIELPAGSIATIVPEYLGPASTAEERMRQPRASAIRLMRILSTRQIVR
jgi:hypothetical protein